MATVNIAVVVMCVVLVVAWAWLWVIAPTEIFRASAALSFVGSVFILAGQAIKVWWPT